MRQQDIMRERGFIPVLEVASITGRAPSTIYRQIEAGKISGQLVGGHWYVRREALAAYLGPAAEALGFEAAPKAV